MRRAKAIILRESGVSSTPQLFDFNISISEYWIARFRGRWRPRAFSRRDAPELCMKTLRPKRAWGMPGARCTRSRAWCVVNTRV